MIGRRWPPSSFTSTTGKPEPAAVLLCTKCYDNAAVLAKLPTGVELIPIQNGFDPQLAAHGHEFEGIASFVSECAAGPPTHANHAARGICILAARTASPPTAVGGLSH